MILPPSAFPMTVCGKPRASGDDPGFVVCQFVNSE